MTLITDTGSHPDQERRSHLTKRILNLTLEIIYLLTGEDFEVVRKTSSEQWAPNSLLSGPPDITTSTPHYLIPERSNMLKVLEVTKKMMELLTGEVPIRCQDVTVYFSMEEWEYLEGHKDLYKDIMMDNQLPLTSPDLPDVSDSSGLLALPSDYKTEDIVTAQDPHAESPIAQNSHQRPSSGDQSSDSEESSEKLHLINPTFPPLVDLPPDPCCPEEPHNVGYRCSLCNKCFSMRSRFALHQRNHSGERPFPCLQCGKCFTSKSVLLRHQQQHSGVRPYSCSECGKSFTWKFGLLKHERRHTGVSLCSCSECGKVFREKVDLAMHQTSHRDERPYDCSECGQRFKRKTHLTSHLRVHTGETFACSECGKCYTRKNNLTAHQKTHADRRLYACAERGETFMVEHALIAYQHTQMD